MKLIDVILENFEKDSVEYKFSKILNEDYAANFDAAEFDATFNDVAGYKPIKTAAMKIAKSAVDSYDLNEADTDEVLRAFSEEYDNSDKSKIDIHSSINELVNSYIHDDIDDDDIDEEYDDDLDIDDDDIDDD